MKYYWSYRLSRISLKELGAVDIIDSHFLWWSLQPGLHNACVDQYVFQADESFLTFLKLKYNKTVAEISKRNYLALRRGESVSLGSKSKTCINILAVMQLMAGGDWYDLCPKDK